MKILAIIMFLALGAFFYLEKSRESIEKNKIEAAFNKPVLSRNVLKPEIIKEEKSNIEEKTDNVSLETVKKFSGEIKVSAQVKVLACEPLQLKSSIQDDAIYSFKIPANVQVFKDQDCRTELENKGSIELSGFMSLSYYFKVHDDEILSFKLEHLQSPQQFIEAKVSVITENPDIITVSPNMRETEFVFTGHNLFKQGKCHGPLTISLKNFSAGKSYNVNLKTSEGLEVFSSPKCINPIKYLIFNSKYLFHQVYLRPTLDNEEQKIELLSNKRVAGSASIKVRPISRIEKLTFFKSIINDESKINQLLSSLPYDKRKTAQNYYDEYKKINPRRMGKLPALIKLFNFLEDANL